MEEDFVIASENSNEDVQYLYQKIVEYNINKVTPTQDFSYEIISLTLKDKEGKIIGGLIANLFMWSFINIDVLWVEDSLRKSGYGTKLLLELEKIAKEKNANMIQVDTFSFQAPEFYKRNGYEVFGILENCPAEGYNRYYLKKNI